MTNSNLPQPQPQPESNPTQLWLPLKDCSPVPIISFCENKKNLKRKRDSEEYEEYVRDILLPFLPYSIREKSCYPDRGSMDIFTLSSIIELKSAKQGSFGMDQITRYKDLYPTKEIILYLINCGNKKRKKPITKGDRPPRTGETENERKVEQMFSHLDFPVTILKEHYGSEVEDRRKNVLEIQNRDIFYLASQNMTSADSEYCRERLRYYLERIKDVNKS